MVFKVDFKKLMNFFQKQPATYVIRKKKLQQNIREIQKQFTSFEEGIAPTIPINKKKLYLWPSKTTSLQNFQRYQRVVLTTRSITIF